MNHRRWSWLIKLAVSAALVAYILWWTPWPDLTASLRAAEPGGVALGVALSAVVTWLHSEQMRILLRATGSRFSRKTVLEVNLATEFYAFFLPGYALAGAYRWYRFTRLGAGSMPTLAALFCNRLINAAIIALSGIVLLFLVPPAAVDRLATVLLVSSFVVLLAVLFAAFHPALADRVGSLAGRRAGATTAGRLATRVMELSKTAGVLGSLDGPTRMRVYGLSLVRQAVAITGYWAFASALSLEISWLGIGLVRAVAALLTLIPISFAGVGVREGGLVYMLARLGVAPGPAVAFSILLLARDLLIRLAGGAVEARNHFRGAPKR